jgi:hypothetical protein
MPWTCPACRTQVQHSTERPRPDRIYRCPVCRLQMIFDSATQKMQVLPPGGDNGEKSPNAA